MFLVWQLKINGEVTYFVSCDKEDGKRFSEDQIEHIWTINNFEQVRQLFFSLHTTI